MSSLNLVQLRGGHTHSKDSLTAKLYFFLGVWDGEGFSHDGLISIKWSSKGCVKIPHMRGCAVLKLT